MKRLFLVWLVFLIFPETLYPAMAVEIKGEPVYAMFDIQRKKSFWDFPRSVRK